MKTPSKKILSLIVCITLIFNGGCVEEDKIVAILREGIQTFAPGQWEDSLNGVLAKLDDVGSDLADKVADQISNLMKDAREQAQALLGYSENQLFCTVDFVGTRVDLRLKKIANDFFPDKFSKPDYSPAICNVVPYVITGGYSGVITYYGFDFTNFAGKYQVNIEEEQGTIIKTNIAKFVYNNNYQGTINLYPKDTENLDSNTKYIVVLTWNDTVLENDPNTNNQRSEVSILPPTATPTLAPFPTPTFPPGYWTPTFSDEDPAQFCTSGYAVNGIQCFGDNCDNLSLSCYPYLSGPDDKMTYWTMPWWISEEEPHNTYANDQVFLLGMQCAGDDCDKILLSYLDSPYLTNKGQCHGLSWVSEEGTNWRMCEAGSFAAGLTCRDDYCDDISLICCRAGY